jgi:hypothetical protein
VPGWLLAAIVAACLATAGWMFWADARLDDATKTDTTSTEDRELAEGVLDVPKDSGDSDDDSRRGDVGRDRLDAGQGTDDGAGDSTDDAPEPDAEPLPPVLKNVAGHEIALAPASVGAGRVADRMVKVGGLRVPCAGGADADRIEAELELLGRVRDVLERAGATVVLLGAEPGGAGCADARAVELDHADLALVLGSGDKQALVLPGRPATDADRASRAASNRFALELGGALDVDGADDATAAERTRLADAGAIDLADGAALAYAEAVVGSDADADALAIAIARAMALTLVAAER